MISVRGVLLAALLALAAGTSAQELQAGPELAVGLDWGLLVERGPHEARVTPWLGGRAEFGWAGGEDTWVLAARARSGALVGSVTSVGLEGLWRSGSPWTEGWIGSWGISAELDAGDALLFGDGPLPLPPSVRVYGGVTFRPLAFRVGEWSWSLFDLGLATPSWDATPWRVSVTPFSLLWNSGVSPSARATAFTLDFSTSVSPGLMGNYMIPQQGTVKPRLAVRTANLEAAVTWSPQFSFYGPFDGAQWSAEVLLAPPGSWQPALGVGLLYSWYVFWSSFFEPAELSPYLVARPLQWAFAVSKETSVTLSTLEFRIGPVIPTPVTGFFRQGSLLLEATLLRAGLQYSPWGGVP